MAGIGFELKKLFRKKGILATFRAYGYAGIVCTGPMLLGVILLLGVTALAQWSGALHLERELLIAMITYTLLASLTVTSIFTMVTTRYTADMLYMEQPERVLPSLWGSCGIMMISGGLLYGGFLLFSGVCWQYQLLCFLLFEELIVVWSEMTYLTAIKDYQKILLAFVAAIVVTFLSALLLIYLSGKTTESVLIGMILGYGVMMVWYYSALAAYFPKCDGSSLAFLKWADQYKALVGTGFFTNIGLFSHLVIMWFGPLGEQIQGLFYGAPSYDVPALVAFLSILVTTINFTTSVEVEFYPKYRTFFALLNQEGTLQDLEESEREMQMILKKELYYLGQRQFFVTLIFIILVLPAIQGMENGFTEDMVSNCRVLCVGYAFYAISNSIMLMSLYFADNRGSVFSTTAFMLISTVGTVVTLFCPDPFYGYGFVVGGAAMFLVAVWRLSRYLGKLKYHVLSRQPVLYQPPDGIFTKVAERMERRYQRQHPIRAEEETE